MLWKFADDVSKGRAYIEYCCNDLIAVAIIGEFTPVFIRPLPLRSGQAGPTALASCCLIGVLRICLLHAARKP